MENVLIGQLLCAIHHQVFSVVESLWIFMNPIYCTFALFPAKQKGAYSREWIL